MPYTHERVCGDCGERARVRSSTIVAKSLRCQRCASKQRERAHKVTGYLALIGDVGALVTRLKTAIDLPMVDAPQQVRVALTKLEDDYADWADAITLERMTRRHTQRIKEKRAS